MIQITKIRNAKGELTLKLHKQNGLFRNNVNNDMPTNQITQMKWTNSETTTIKMTQEKETLNGPETNKKINLVIKIISSKKSSR